jgi:hypothetical protein
MIDELAERYSIDTKRIAIFGSSSGCNLLWTMVSKYPDKFRFIATFGGGANGAFVDEGGLRSAAKFAKVFVARGAVDNIFSPAEFAAATRRLTLLGFRVDSETFPHLGHDGRVFRDRVLAVCDRLTLDASNNARPPKIAWDVALEGKWHGLLTTFKPALPNGPGHKKSYPDPGISETALSLARFGSGFERWPTVTIPGNWHDWGGRWSIADGEAVIGRAIDVPKAMAGKDALLSLGPISNYDDTFFNGRLVGRTDHNKPFYWVAERQYSIPGKLVTGGRNIVMIRIWDGLGGGGLYGGPSEDIRFKILDK